MNPTQDSTRRCPGYQRDPHDVENVLEKYRPSATYCRECDRQFRADRKKTGPARPRSASRLATVDFGQVADEEVVARSHEYVPDGDLVKLWHTVTKNTLTAGAPPANLMFIGPSGSGKTDGAAYLAARVGLPFTKVDAASMTDPEAWFGTREVTVEDGASVTKYQPSAFVEAIQKPGVTFIDEVNRVDDEHRNVLLPLLDGTGRVMNPLTGEQVVRHPHAFVIMAGNRGLQFTGTSAIDPAFMTRALVVEFEYLDAKTEEKVAVEATGIDADEAAVFVRFASETRAKAMSDPDFIPISTREVISACRLVAGGLTRDLAARFVILNGASPEGGSASIRQELQNIWNGVRVVQRSESPADQAGAPVVGSGASASIACGECQYANPPGRTAICANCGASLV